MADIVSEKGALVADERENTVVEAAAPEVEKTGTGDVPPAKQKFVTRDVVMCIVVLAAIALVAGVLLGAMNWLTYVDPEAAILERVAGYYSVSADAVVSVPERVVSEGSSYVSGCYAVETGSGTVYVYHAVGIDSFPALCNTAQTAFYLLCLMQCFFWRKVGANHASRIQKWTWRIKPPW